MPGRISTVTIATDDVATLVAAYTRHLGYHCIEQAVLDPVVAGAWGLPGLTGRQCALLVPGGAGDTYLRFVESPATPGYRPFRQLGWNAAEIIVQHVDALAGRLAASPFRQLGPPADLSFTDRIRAMQVVGPAGEVLYLTEVKGAVPGFELPLAAHPVDRVFIMILGGARLDDVVEWYARSFALPRVAAMDSVASALSTAYGLDPGTRHRIAAVPLGAQCYLEADQMPAAALPRTSLAGELPPAIAMVSFEVTALPGGVTWVAPPATPRGLPYAGRRCAVCRGPAGELIELIATAA